MGWWGLFLELEIRMYSINGIFLKWNTLKCKLGILTKEYST